MVYPEFNYDDYSKIFTMKIPSIDNDFFVFKTDMGKIEEEDFIKIEVSSTIGINIREIRGFNGDKEDLFDLECFFKKNNIITNTFVSVITSVTRYVENSKTIEFVYLNTEQFIGIIKEKLITVFSTLELEYDIKFSKFYKVYVANLFAKTLGIIYTSIIEKSGKETCNV